VPQHGSGTYVAEIAEPAAPPAAGPFEAARLPPQSRFAERLRTLEALSLAARGRKLRFDLQYGEPLLNPALLDRWRAELSQAALRTDIGYAPVQGLEALRRAVSDYLARRRGVLADPQDVLIVSGTQQALSLSAQLLLDDGACAAIEEPHYQLADRALRAYGARVLACPTDAEGLQVDALPQPAPRLIYTTPSHQFPGGAVLSQRRRSALLEYASEHQCWIFEDDYDAEFRYASRPIPALRSMDTHDRVIYSGSFSKSLFPALRLGYVVCPRGLRDDFVRAKRITDLGCGAIEQAAVASLIESGRFEIHLRKATLELKRRRGALLDGLKRHAGEHVQVLDSQAGMHAVGWLPRFSYAQLEQLVELALARGLGLHPIHTCYAVKPAIPGLLFGYAGLSVSQLQTATRLLKSCLQDVEAQPAPPR
jgi:GntR family transcriptional regulator/MocR family aminotransferase